MASAPESLLALINAEQSTICEVFEARARQTPNAPFLLWREQRFSYAEARAHARRFAAYLHTLPSWSHTCRVAAFATNAPEALWTWLGVAYAGGVFVPINRGHKGDLLRNALISASAKILITEDTALSDLPDVTDVGIETLVVINARQPVRVNGISSIPFSEAHASEEGLPLPHATPDDTACIMFTSGTTGPSKGVRIPHNQYCRGAARLVDAYGLKSTDVFHNWLPLFHLGGQLHMTMTAVICGGAVSLHPTFSTSEFPAQVRAHKASVLCGFAAILHFLDSLPEEARDCGGSLRVGIFAGIPPDLGKRISARFGVSLGENYGMTEADPITAPIPGVIAPEGSIGRATPEFEVRIVAPDGTPAAPAAIGEIAIRPLAQHVMFSGYEGDGATNRGWRDGWFHTGDYGAADAQGFLFYNGRGDNYIRRRGENISVSELCDIILKHAAVQECIAVAVPSDVGEDDVKLVYVTAQDAVCEPATLFAFARANMARFMVPRYYERLAELPRTDVGKIRIGALKAHSDGVWDAAAQSGDAP